MRSRLSWTPALKLGDAAQLTIRVTGAGDLAAFPMQAPPLPKALRAFNAQRQVDRWRESELVGGTLTWTLPVQATRSGRFKSMPFPFDGSILRSVRFEKRL